MLNNSQTALTSTIAAIATPMGRGGVGVIRLSGPNSYQIALALTGRQAFKPRCAHLCRGYDRDTTVVEQG